MEINIGNAFKIFVKISLRPFLTSFEGISQKIQGISNRLVLAILKKPLLSTMIFTCLSVVFFSILTVSTLILAGVFCIVLGIIIFEGYILGVILMLTAAISILSLGFLILLSGSKLPYESSE